MKRAILVLAGVAIFGAMAAAEIVTPEGPAIGGSKVVKVDLPESVAAGEYEMESLVEGNKLAQKQVDLVKLEVEGQKVSGKYLKTQSGNGMDSKFVGEWEKGSTAAMTLKQSSPDGYTMFCVLQASAKDTFSGTWVDNADHHGVVKIVLKKGEK